MSEEDWNEHNKSDTIDISKPANHDDLRRLKMFNVDEVSSMGQAWTQEIKEWHMEQHKGLWSKVSPHVKATSEKLDQYKGLFNFLFKAGIVIGAFFLGLSVEV